MIKKMKGKWGKNLRKDSKEEQETKRRQEEQIRKEVEEAMKETIETVNYIVATEEGILKKWFSTRYGKKSRKEG